MCRICFSKTNPFTGLEDLISPCACKGSVKYVHSTCLKMWRYKNNIFKELKTCEQCRTHYSYSNDRMPCRWFIALVTFLVIMAGYGFTALVFNSLLQIFFISGNCEATSASSCGGDPTAAINFQDYKYHLTCIMMLMTIAKMIFHPSVFALFNYLFTFWRIAQFGFFIDKIIFFVISFFFLKEIFWSLYQSFDRLHFVLSNAYRDG